MDAVPFPTAGPLLPQPGAARHALLRLVTVMLDGEDEREVLWGAMAAIAATGPFTAEAAYTVHDGLARRCPPRQAAAPAVARPGNTAAREPAVDPTREAPAEAAAADVVAADRLDRRIDALDGRSRHLHEPGVPWVRAIALRYRDNCLGYLVVRSLTTPSAEETALTDLLAQQTGIALARLTGIGEPVTDREPTGDRGRATHRQGPARPSPPWPRGSPPRTRSPAPPPPAEASRESCRPCTTTRDSRPSPRTASATRGPGLVPAGANPRQDPAVDSARSRRPGAGTP